MKWWHYIIIIICWLLLLAFVGLGCYSIGKRMAPIQRDTLTTVVTVRDTITQYKPEYITKEVIRKELVEVTDTITIHDTTYIVLPFERREYRDSNYFAVVTGFRPELEQISVFPETKYVTKIVTQTVQSNPTRFGIGVQVGFGASYGIISKQMDCGPYIGIGFSYNFVRF